MKKFLATLFLLVLVAPVFSAEFIDTNTGLECDNPQNLKVVVEGVKTEGERLGVSNELIQAKAENFLRKNGIKPSSETRPPHMLYISVAVLENGAFSISVEFTRGVLFPAKGKIYSYPVGKTWKYVYTGSASPEDCLSHLSNLLERLLERFVADYAKANNL